MSQPHEESHSQSVPTKQEESNLLPLYLREKLISFQLRAEISSMSFYSLLWPVMPSLGWKYDKKDGSYTSPNGIRFDNSKDAMTILDCVALPKCDMRHLWEDSNSNRNRRTQISTIEYQGPKEEALEMYWLQRFHSTETNSMDYPLGEPFHAHAHDESTLPFDTWKEKVKVTREQLLEAVFHHLQKDRRGQKRGPIELNNPTPPITGFRLFESQESVPPAPPLPLFSFKDTTENQESINNPNNNPKVISNQNTTHSEEPNSVQTSHVNAQQNKKSNSILPASATTIELGAEEYFHPRPKTRNQKQKTEEKVQNGLQPDGFPNFLPDVTNSKQPSLVETSSSQQQRSIFFDSTKLIWPSPQECVKNIQLQQLQDSQNDLFFTHREKKLYQPHFKEWAFLLTTNHSILFYGFGSKKHLVNQFTEDELRPHGHVLTLHGYDNTISIDAILDVIVQSFLDGQEPISISKSVDSSILSRRIATKDTSQVDNRLLSAFYSSSPTLTRAMEISQALAQRPTRVPIYIVVHNIDGVGLRSPVAQDALAILVSQSQKSDQDHLEPSRVVRLVATVDHLNASAILWENDTWMNFRWIWKLVNTHRPYYDEVLLGVTDTARKMKAAQSKQLDMTFMERVLRSLAPRHTEVLHQLADLQLSQHNHESSSSSSSSECIEYATWKKRCFEKMIVTKESDLQSMMKELIDHGIMECKRDDKTFKDLVSIPTTKAKLRDILEATNKTKK